MLMKQNPPGVIKEYLKESKEVPPPNLKEAVQKMKDSATFEFVKKSMMSGFKAYRFKQK